MVRLIVCVVCLQVFAMCSFAEEFDFSRHCLAPQNKHNLRDYLLESEWFFNIIKSLRNKTDLKYREYGLVINPGDELTETAIRKKIKKGYYCSLYQDEVKEGGVEFHTHPNDTYRSIFPSVNDLISWKFSKNEALLVSNGYMLSFSAVKDSIPLNQYQGIKNTLQKLQFLKKHSNNFKIYRITGSKAEAMPESDWWIIAMLLKSKKYRTSRFHKVFKYHHELARKRGEESNQKKLHELKKELSDVYVQLDDYIDRLHALILSYRYNLVTREKFKEKYSDALHLYNYLETIKYTSAEHFAIRSVDKEFSKKFVKSCETFATKIDPAVTKAKEKFREYIQLYNEKNTENDLSPISIACAA